MLNLQYKKENRQDRETEGIVHGMQPILLHYLDRQERLGLTLTIVDKVLFISN
jgi:hypothetical protein